MIAASKDSACALTTLHCVDALDNNLQHALLFVLVLQWLEQWLEQLHLGVQAVQARNDRLHRSFNGDP
jgi:hypothetical protein